MAEVMVITGGSRGIGAETVRRRGRAKADPWALGPASLLPLLNLPDRGEMDGAGDSAAMGLAQKFRRRRWELAA